MGTSVELGHALFGRTRREVLALLLGRPDERLHLREIFRRIGGGSGAVQRELKQLVEAGLVLRENEGRQVYFSANPNASVFRELQAIMEKTAGAPEVLRATLEPLTQGRRIIISFVYGSVASGAQTATSDVDLFVLGDATLADMIPALRTAEARLGREINASIYPVREFRKRIKAGTPFLNRLLTGPKLFIAGTQDDLERLAR